MSATTTEGTGRQSEASRQRAKLLHARSVLAAELPLRILVLGDSVAAGCSASTYRQAFPALWASELQQAHGSPVQLFNLSVAGQTSSDGLEEAEDAARDYQPDLALVAFGLNDIRIASRSRRHPFRRPAPRVSPSLFRSNVHRIADRLRRRGGTDVILVAPWPQAGLDEYRQTLAELAAVTEFALADVAAEWPEDGDALLDDERLHPNDAGHRLYVDALRRLGL